MLDDRPGPVFILWIMLCLVLSYLAYKLPGDNEGWMFIKFVIAVMALGSLIVGGKGLAEYLIWLWGDANHSRYSIILAETMAPMNPHVARIWEQHTDIEVLGMIGPDLRINFRVRTKDIDVDYDFAQKFMAACEEFYPHTAPIGRAYELTEDHKNAERMASALIGQLADLSIVEPGLGNKTATFKVTWNQIARGFNLE